MAAIRTHQLSKRNGDTLGARRRIAHMAAVAMLGIAVLAIDMFERRI
jgi:hypothetical protein